MDVARQQGQGVHKILQGERGKLKHRLTLSEISIRNVTITAIIKKSFHLFNWDFSLLEAEFYRDTFLGLFINPSYNVLGPLQEISTNLEYFCITYKRICNT